MAQDFGTGVTRTLSAAERQFQIVVWQASKPPLDSELNLLMQADWERHANLIRSQMHSGFLLDPFQSDTDFVTNSNWSNFFKLGRPDSGTSPVLWANVNGWLVPVTGTDVGDSDISNRINLFPGPSTDARVDFIFLEVWLAQVAPNPSVVNKPSASTVWKYGNVEFGGTNIADDLEDPAIGFETTERVQLQYRLRVLGSGTGLGDSIDLAAFPDGMGDPNVLARGGATAPQAGFTWTNMRDELGDPGLWRSGDGVSTNALATVDGYSYAVPVCGVFRRNTATFVARTNAGNANQNGGKNRNPRVAAITDPVEGTRIFTAVTLTTAIDEDDVGAIAFTGLTGSGIDNPDIVWASTFLKMDDEIFGISAYDTGAGTLTVTSRGRNGSQAAPHDVGAVVEFFNFRPDGKFADEITASDILDLRKGVTPGEWDYQALLGHNLGKLFENSLHTSYKQSGISDTQGAVVLEVDTLYANGGFPIPNQTEALDGPDGIRTIFSDAAVVEHNVSVLLKPTIGGGGTPVVVADFTVGASSWEPAADFEPAGFQPNDQGWTDQAVINLFIDGVGNRGARGTVRTAADNEIVRFVAPREYWLTRDELVTGTSGNQTPFLLRLIEEGWGDPAGSDEPVAGHPGPLYPLPEHNFERPFIVLGGTVNPNLIAAVTTVAAGSVPTGLSQVRFAGEDFDLAGNWYPTGDVTSLSVTGVTETLLHGTRTLYDMLTWGGRDLSGASSELYIVLTGDLVNAANAGVFRVIGAGNTAGYTTESGATADALVVERVGVGAATLVAAAGVSASVRSQYTHTSDGTVGGDPAAVVVLTDLLGAAGGTTFPWDGLLSTPANGQAVLDTSIQYGPSRGGTARVADRLSRVALSVVDSANLVREAPTTIDSTFDNEAGVPDGEVYFPLNHIQTWNRLPSQGQSAPLAVDYGDGTTMAEYRREAEVFVDAGSKTLMVRPYQQADLALVRYRATAGGSNRFFPLNYTVGPYLGNVDGGGLFTVNADYAYAVPHEFMPRLGRQDIPFHQTTGVTGPVFYGVNHLFGDSQTNTDDVFRVIGGMDSDAAVLPLYFQTGASSTLDYGEFSTISGPADGYQARIYTDVNVISSDMPRGLTGIQLPPFLGVARLLGVYDRREFIGAGLGAWSSDRVTPSAAPGRPANLLRTDRDKQTLFIARGGASDVTGSDEDHTYVIPSTMIDVRLSGAFVPGDTFASVEFIVEAEVFGFGTGFITQNNYVLARLNLPTTGATGNNGIAVATLAPAVSMILPLPLPYNEQLYVAYERTVYQGDPYMTRDGATRTISDYEHRYGQIPASGSALLTTPIQQFDSTSNYDQVPEYPNPRSLEVLASMDFYTTLGTGKIGGPVVPGTVLDVSHVSNRGIAPTRIAATITDPIWQSEPRTFTQPQGQGASRASLTLNVLLASAASTGEIVQIRRGTTSENFVSDTDMIGVSAALTAAALVAAINASDFCRMVAGVHAVYAGGTTLRIISLLPGKEGGDTSVVLTPPTVRFMTGYEIVLDQGALSQYGLVTTRSALLGGVDVPMNASALGFNNTPIRMTGLTERLPLGILLQDADFIGEDPLRNGSSSLKVWGNGGTAGPTNAVPLLGTEEYGRIEGAGQIGMADGSILQYRAWTLSTPTGTKQFRLFRGGGSAYVLDPTPAGGPLDWSSEGFPQGSEPVVKGAVLAGRAYLVRNYPETAYTAPEGRSYGDEIQMVILTQGVVGEGPLCEHGYTLDGIISPTGYGEGMAAADRYRLEGKPQIAGHSRQGANPVVDLLAPFPSEDEVEDPCP